MTYHPRKTRAIMGASLLRRARIYVTTVMLGLIAPAPQAVGAAAQPDVATADGWNSNPVGHTGLVEVLDPPAAAGGDQSVTSKLAQLSDQDLARMAILARAIRVLAPSSAEANRLAETISDRGPIAEDATRGSNVLTAATELAGVTDGDINISLLANQIIHRAPLYQLGGKAGACGPPLGLTALNSASYSKERRAASVFANPEEVTLAIR